MNIFREILHYKDSSSDKVYIVEVNHIDSMYVISATWGKRTAARLSTQIKAEVGYQGTAMYEAEKCLKAKRKEGYLPAAKGLSIPGYKPKGTSTVAVMKSSQQASDVKLEKDDISSSLRKLKL